MDEPGAERALRAQALIHRWAAAHCDVAASAIRATVACDRFAAVVEMGMDAEFWSIAAELDG